VLTAVGALALGAVLVLFDFRTLTPRLQIESEVEKLLPNDGEEKLLYERFRERFGSDSILFVGMVTDDVFSAENLRRIRRMTQRFAQVDGVREVVSLSNAPDIKSQDGSVSIQSVFDEVPSDPAERRALRESVLGNPLHVGTLVSADGRAVAFLVYPREMSEREFRDRGIDHTIQSIAREEATDAEILMAGTPPLKAATSRILLQDLLTFIPLGYLFMAIVAFAAFRSVRGVAIPAGAITLGQIWTLAVMVLAGRSLNLVTFIVPPLINAVGFAYSVHMVSEHDDLIREGERGPQAVRLALRRVAFPIFLTAVTTAAGFLSLCLSRIPAIREFGALCVVGVIGSLVAALTFAPAVLAVLRDPSPAPRATGAGRFERLAGRLAVFDVRHRGWVLGVGGAVAALAAVGLTRIEVSTSFTGNLKPDHPLRQSVTAFDQNLAGSSTMYVMLETGERDAFKRPENIRALRELQLSIDELPKVGDTSSLADYLMVVNRAFHDGDPEHFTIPASEGLVSKFLFFLWNDQLGALVDSGFTSTNILVRRSRYSSSEGSAMIKAIESRLDVLPESIDASVTGQSPLIIRTIDEITRGQALSLSGATLIIFGILVAYFRSLRIALLALIPNALPVLVYFGVLGLSGVTLNIITSLIACIILGIAVDDTIHFLVRFREQVRIVGDEGKAAEAALRLIVRPVTVTTAALCAAFAALIGSGLKHQVEFGVLATCMLAFAWLVDMTFTPALCARMGFAREGAAAGRRAMKGRGRPWSRSLAPEG
jgi:predicted RND superfamily exporter protein